jgi:hypothetical protein
MAAGDERVDADPVLAEIARHASRQAVHGCLGAGAGRKAARGAPPRVRPQIDDRSAARVDHP